MDVESAKLIISITAVVFALLNFVYARFQVQSGLNNRLSKLESSYEHALNSIAQLKTDTEGLVDFTNVLRPQIPKIDLFWDFVRAEFPKMMLHHNDTGRDELLMKLSSNTISRSEALNLKAILENEFEHMTDRTSTDALINRWTWFANEQVLKEEGRY